MKKLAMVVVCGLASAAVAADRPYGLTPVLGQPTLSQLPPAPGPVPDTTYSVPTLAPAVSGPVYAMPVATAALYGNVRVKDRRNIAPCAVPTVVQVPDPCNDGCCVNVEICVPPCEKPCIKTSRCGKKVKYDYGKYAVEITSARGKVTVDYDD